MSYCCPYMLWLGCRFYFIWHCFALDPILTGHTLLPHPYDISWAIMKDHVLDWRNQSIVCLPRIYYGSIRPHGTFDIALNWGDSRDTPTGLCNHDRCSFPVVKWAPGHQQPPRRLEEYNCATSIISFNIHITLQPLNKHCSRKIGRSAKISSTPL